MTADTLLQYAATTQPGPAFRWCPSIAWMNTHNTHMRAIYS